MLREGLELTPSADSKVDPRVDDRYYLGKRVPIGRTLNAFGLSSGEDASCPGATPSCQSDCYAINLEQRPQIASKLAKNFEAIQACESVEEVATLLRPLVQGFSNRADKFDLSDVERMFRIHWAGDFVSEMYAQGWAEVITEFEDIDFTAYTRTWPRTDPETGRKTGPNVLPILSGIGNLSLYMSIDKDNMHDAVEPYTEHHRDVRLAFYDKDYSRSIRIARELAERYEVPDLRPDDPSNLIMCPEENPYMTMGGSMLELVNLDRRDVRRREEMFAQGNVPTRKHPNYRGACVDCHVCYGSRNKHVVFADVKRMHAKGTGNSDGQLDFGIVGTSVVPVRLSAKRSNTFEEVPDSTPHPTLF